MGQKEQRISFFGKLISLKLFRSRNLFDLKSISRSCCLNHSLDDCNT